MKSVDLIGAADNVKNFLEKVTKMWKTTLTINSEVIGIVDIRREIFQDDSLSPLLFIIALIPLTIVLRKMNKGYQMENVRVNNLLYMDDLKLYAQSNKEIESLVNTVRIFSDDIHMQFGLDKCAKVRKTIASTENIRLPSKKENWK